MKSLLPPSIALLLVGCVSPLPYADQPPPRLPNGEVYYPYATGRPAPYAETGPPGTATPAPTPAPPLDSEVGVYEALPSNAPTSRPTPGPAPAPAPAPPLDSAAPRQPQTTPTAPGYPFAKRTENPNRVVSPFAPYNVIDVEGFKSGALAKDPSNGKIFRVP
ncbi:MAG: hypothetical protein EAZ65_03060 [Verrucomicrobia bacterium]|nr:MAG: hypothetical protein EAZ84_02130 [Verrucomicrobiota bacterium]TAE88360.1 MAG: hypothetical protein EAZ82_03745 [Verrucomicrobiota bacterium]TAF26814.1 MAG: hypothetical protein EAZ71_03055 [Verrucomicrobiota bacterium]TAF42071.1 MAG: hypothetical protein EAZ65_03060 [Verrucomicrobiota bacterium]